MFGWISIMDFSNKYGISPSTVRRRIKDRSLVYKVRNGKYFIQDSKPIEDTDTNTDTQKVNTKTTPSIEEILSFSEKSITTMSKLHQEISEEKDKRISLQDRMIKQLREEITELKMLISLLEKKDQQE